MVVVYASSSAALKPVVNTNGFYDGLLRFLKHSISDALQFANVTRANA